MLPLPLGITIAGETETGAIHVYWIADGCIERRAAEDLAGLLARQDGFVWLDLPVVDKEAAQALREVFGFHPLAVQSVLEPTILPKIHTYADHIFVCLLAPEMREGGEVRVVELEQFIGQRYLVTSYGPGESGLPRPAALQETKAVLRRIEAGRFRPATPYELTYAIVSALVRRLTDALTELARQVGVQERRVISGELGDAEGFTESLFKLRHRLLTVRTMAAQDREMMARLSTLAPRVMPAEAHPYAVDLVDQFERVRSICDGEREFLQGVVDFYQTRLQTKMNVAIERLALLTAAVLPMTAIGSIYGMNLIVHDQTQPQQLALVLALMFGLTGAMLAWARRQGWW